MQLAGLTGGIMSDAYRSPEETASIEAVKQIGGAPGGNPDAANVTTTGEIDWSKGNLPGIDNTQAKQDIYNQQNPNFPDDPNIVNSVTGDTPETYAQKFTNGDLSKVQSRITDINGFPQVEFFSKDLGDIVGEIGKGIVSAPGALINSITNLVSNIVNPTPADTVKVAQTYPSDFSTFLSNLLNPTPPTPTTSDNGFRSSQTQPTQTSAPNSGTKTGGDNGSTGVPSVAIPPITTKPTTTPTTSTTTPAGVVPVGTGMDLTRRPYTGNPLVETTSVAYPNYKRLNRFT
jgi:hypothetical protein